MYRSGVERLSARAARCRDPLRFPSTRPPGSSSPLMASVAPDQVPPEPLSAATATVTSDNAYMSLFRPIALPTENPESGAYGEHITVRPS